MPNNNLEEIFNTQIQFVSQIALGELSFQKAYELLYVEPSLSQMEHIGIGYLFILYELQQQNSNMALKHLQYIQKYANHFNNSQLDFSLYFVCQYVFGIVSNIYPNYTDIKNKVTEMLLDFFVKYPTLYLKEDYQKILESYMQSLKETNYIHKNTLKQLHGYIVFGINNGIQKKIISQYSKLINDKTLQIECGHFFEYVKGLLPQYLKNKFSLFSQTTTESKNTTYVAPHHLYQSANV